MYRRRTNSEQSIGLLCSLPVFLLIFLMMGFPFVYTVWLSFTDKTAGSLPRFIGFDNYIALYRDPLYWKVIANTFIYTALCTALKLAMGTGAALFLNREFAGRTIVRLLMLLPWAIPGMVAALTWKWMYNDQYGIINSLIRGLHLSREPIPWLGDMRLALFSVMIVNIWRGVPFFLFSILGALQSIDSQLYDAGKIDGAGVFSRFFNITLPSCLPVMTITTLLSAIWTFNDFDNIWLITGGGPLNASSVAATYVYEQAFLYNEMGRGLAAAVSVMPILILCMTLLGAGRKEQ